MTRVDSVGKHWCDLDTWRFDDLVELLCKSCSVQWVQLLRAAQPLHDGLLFHKLWTFRRPLPFWAPGRKVLALSMRIHWLSWDPRFIFTQKMVAKWWRDGVFLSLDYSAAAWRSWPQYFFVVPECVPVANVRDKKRSSAEMLLGKRAKSSPARFKVFFSIFPRRKMSFG